MHENFCSFDYSLLRFQIQNYALKQLMINLAKSFTTESFEAKTMECPSIDASDLQMETAIHTDFEKLLLNQIAPNSRVFVLHNDYSLEYLFNISIVGEQDNLLVVKSSSLNTSPMEIATIANNYKVEKVSNVTMIKPLRRFFRIGVAEVCTKFGLKQMSVAFG